MRKTKRKAKISPRASTRLSASETIVSQYNFRTLRGAGKILRRELARKPAREGLAYRRPVLV
jgi:hypothetical protein